MSQEVDSSTNQYCLPFFMVLQDQPPKVLLSQNGSLLDTKMGNISNVKLEQLDSSLLTERKDQLCIVAFRHLYTLASFASSQPQFSHPTSISIQAPSIAYLLHAVSKQDQEVLHMLQQSSRNLLPHTLNLTISAHTL